MPFFHRVSPSLVFSAEEKSGGEGAGCFLNWGIKRKWSLDEHFSEAVILDKLV